VLSTAGPPAGTSTSSVRRPGSAFSQERPQGEAATVAGDSPVWTSTIAARDVGWLWAGCAPGASAVASAKPYGRRGRGLRRQVREGPDRQSANSQTRGLEHGNRAVLRQLAHLRVVGLDQGDPLLAPGIGWGRRRQLEFLNGGCPANLHPIFQTASVRAPVAGRPRDVAALNRNTHPVEWTQYRLLLV